MKESACNAGDPSSTPGSGRSPWRKAWLPTPVILPGKIPRTEEPGKLRSMGWQRIGPEWAINTFTLSLSMHCPTPFSALCLGLSAQCLASKLLVTGKPAQWSHLFAIEQSSVSKRRRVAGLGLRLASPCTVQGIEHTCSPPATTNSVASYPHTLHIQALYSACISASMLLS